MADFDQEKRHQEKRLWSHSVCGYLAAFLLPVAAAMAMTLLVRSFPSFRFQGILLLLAALVVERERLLHERAEAQAHVLALATTDPVTALPNHRTLIDRLDQELERAQ